MATSGRPLIMFCFAGICVVFAMLVAVGKSHEGHEHHPSAPPPGNLERKSASVTPGRDDSDSGDTLVQATIDADKEQAAVICDLGDPNRKEGLETVAAEKRHTRGESGHSILEIEEGQVYSVEAEISSDGTVSEEIMVKATIAVKELIENSKAFLEANPVAMENRGAESVQVIDGVEEGVMGSETFALEVIPTLAKEYATRRNVDPFPRILKWEFTKRPRPNKVKKIIKDRMYADPEITPTNQETAQWYYDGLQNVDDLYPAPGSLDNMPDEYEDGRSTTPPQSTPTNAAGPSGAATPTPTTGVADIPTPHRQRFRGPSGVRTQRHESVIQSFQELRKEFKDFESQVQDRLEIVLDELRDSNRRREEEHAELMRIFRSYRHNDDQSHTPLGHSLSMSQYARSYHPLDPPVGLQNSAENSAEVQDPPVGQQNSAEVQDPPVGIQNSPNVQDPPLMAQQTSKVQDPPVNCRPVRLRKRGWQQTTPYTDPCKPKRAKSASHKFKPDEKVDAEVLADYVTFKEEPNGRRDVDIQLIVDVPWFVQFESNNSILEDTHLDAYLKIVRKRQRMFLEVYQQNVNIIDLYFYTNMVNWCEEMMPAGTTDKHSEEWPVLSYKWTAEQIAWARGKNVGGCRPWNEVDADFFDFVLVTVVKAMATPDSAVELPLTTKNVENVMDEVRPYLIADGGNVALHEIDGNVVRLKLQGVGSRVSKCVYLLFLPLLVFVEYVKD
ncbi:hypothetical protein LWI29_002583 [Acer saccharum]|uniref:NIF system FeS cluster assembly NifU C-terminal domain-containing protein n=1 Tax=Acer saccharum TaxID=4024 RepID=A0AA39VY33_ACESA|nr:hypothetical protein LWI29_002583 [Acer saccharum]